MAKWIPINYILSNGIETTATLSSGWHHYSPRRYSKNELTLLFSDAQGTKRSVEGVRITDQFLREITKWNAGEYIFTRATVLIKYMAGAGCEYVRGAPTSCSHGGKDMVVIPEDTAYWQRDNVNMMMVGGVVMAIAFGISVLFYLVDRRRRSYRLRRKGSVRL